MIIIGFSKKTHLKIANHICKNFKHCAVIIPVGHKFVLHQFVKRNNVIKIAITKRSITQLERKGWVFIFLYQSRIGKFNTRATTCVNYAKTALNIKNFWIQTPDALYRYLQKNLT